MALKLRPLKISPPVYEDRKDYAVVSGEFVVGRIYEDRAVTREELRWFWAINGILNQPPVMRADGRAPTLDHAKAEVAENWRKWLAWARLAEMD